MNSLLIRNAGLIITMAPYSNQFKGWDILILEGKIAEVEKSITLNDSIPVIDARDMIVFPGLINTHHHFFQNLTRNLPAGQNAGLFDWLRFHYPVWAEMDEECIEISTKVAIAELLLSGVTSTVDHLYLFPGETGARFIDREISAAKEMKIRFFPTRGSMSVGKSRGGLPPDNVVQTEKDILEDSKRVIKTYHDPSPGSMLEIILAPCSPFSVSGDLMEQTARLSDEYGVHLHTHLAETKDEELYCKKRYGVRPFKFLESVGWMNNKAFFAHSIFLNQDEIFRMAQTRAGVSTCPSSNMRLGSGIAPIREMLDRGIPVAIGVDGSASNDQSNMLLEMRQALLISRLRERHLWLTAKDVWEMATINAARLLGREDLGKIEKGYSADIAMISMKNLALSGAGEDLAAGLLFSLPFSPVNYTIVNGYILVKDGNILTESEDSLIEKHSETAQSLIDRYRFAEIQTTG